MKAIGKRLVVEMENPVGRKGSIILPESAMGVLRNMGKVISVGGECSADVKVDDYILVRGVRSIPNLPYDVVEEADIICVVNEQDIIDIKEGKHIADSGAIS